MNRIQRKLAALLLVECLLIPGSTAFAAEQTGGGYAVSGQLENVGYSYRFFHAGNGLPTSDANCIYASSDGYIWIGSYAGVVRYDGNQFELLNPSGGLANGKTIYEDHKGRIWVGTNDNGIVMLDGNDSKRFTYKDGLPSSSIRSIVEGEDDVIYVGTTTGVCYIDTKMQVHTLADPVLEKAYVIHLEAGENGEIYGNTKNGDIFILQDQKMKAFFQQGVLGVGNVTAISRDEKQPGYVYLGTETGEVYHGTLEKGIVELKRILKKTDSEVSWVQYACDRLWIVNGDAIGYLDEDKKYHALEGCPLNTAIETMTVDYQGNLWFSSTRQGVMEVVTNQFQNISEQAGLEEGVVNTTCMNQGKLYIGMDKGLRILDENKQLITNSLTEMLEGTRIRCIMKDVNHNLWISTYTNDFGLVLAKATGEIIVYNEANGFISDGVRGTYIAKDGSVYVCTNGGLAILKNGEVVRNIDAESGIDNTVFLTVTEDENGKILIGTDGDGIYEVDGDQIRHIGREEGLTSDVILRLKRDEKRGVTWIITSNSIQYKKEDAITQVEQFPYSNNYDVYFSKTDDMWILSSYGIYCVSAEEMLGKNPLEYSLYDTASGLPSVPTGNAYSELDDTGNLYVAGREGVSRINIDHYMEQSGEIRFGLKNVTYDEQELKPDSDGRYVIPSNAGRIQFRASILNYQMSNPTIRMYLQGAKDEGLIMQQNRLQALEYTGLPYGDYVLHIQILNYAGGSILQEASYQITKLPKPSELVAIRVLVVAVIVLLVGLLIWRILSGNIIRKQFEEIRLAKEEADRTNTAQSRFLANMSQEIRTPINTIIGLDELIFRENANEVPKDYHTSMMEYAKDIQTVSESLQGIITEILDLSKMESGKMHLQEKVYELEGLLQSLISTTRARCSKKDLQFKVNIDPGLPTKVCGDEVKIRKVVMNLLGNAVKYTEKGTVSLTVQVLEKVQDKATISFSVKDTGIGIKPEDMEKIYGAFERVEAEKHGWAHGIGLGLDISRQLAHMLQGELTCQSEYGQGSTFELTVSQRIASEDTIGFFDEYALKKTKDSYAPAYRAPDGEVLIVDSNAMNRMITKKLLQDTKMFITTAGSGEECLEKIRYNHYHVVLLDERLSDLDYLEVIRRIREDRMTLPVYALATEEDEGGEDFYISHGFTGYLLKPVDGATLEKTIRKHLPDDIVMENTDEV